MLEQVIAALATTALPDLVNLIEAAVNELKSRSDAGLITTAVAAAETAADAAEAAKFGS